MKKNIRLVVALCALALFAASAAHEAAPPAAAQRRGLTPQEQRGKTIYLRGESPSGKEITAEVAEVPVPASTVTCAGCHGLRGEGKTEGGVTAGGLTWSNLLKPHTHPTGRKHGPFDEASFARAVRAGTDPAGNELAVAMPRFRLSPEDLADLLAYLRRIETETDPGLTDDAVRVGVVLPTTGALTELGLAMRDVLYSYFEDLNARGGIYNRRVVLYVAASGADAATTAANARRLVEQEGVFAFVGGMSAGADKELAALARESETPFVGPATLLPQTDQPLNRQVFYLLPGLTEQARALVNFAAAGPEPKKGRVVILHPEGELAAAVAAAVEDQAQKDGLRPVLRQPYARGGFDARQLVTRIKGTAADSLFILGTGGEEATVLSEAAAAGWTPSVFLLGALTGGRLTASVPPAFKDRVFVAFPTIPSDLTPGGLAEFRALQEKYKFPPRHTASQLAAFAAAKVFAEGLRRAGRELSREKLITALEGLYDYETGVTPRITFGPNRRVGVPGANILKVDVDKKEFTPAPGPQPPR
ncbi:MAG TPA: ABC transporter substrate-binding protein [Pyrinomonadaceae bacterium]|jgi:ABC-type branched-subunit amino acid transport system substrate-binding protein|nr:ABC transporter substrate-binding protein [Pyrinomonadaceae bacterium]